MMGKMQKNIYIIHIFIVNFFKSFVNKPNI
jgi:hypothetical protein